VCIFLTSNYGLRILATDLRDEVKNGKVIIFVVFSQVIRHMNIIVFPFLQNITFKNILVEFVYLLRYSVKPCINIGHER
jgi:hypothetical protein